MTQKPKTPPLPAKGGSYTVDGRNRLKAAVETKPAPANAAAAEKDVNDA
ncbi:hypothetical protein [Thalassovita sp.]|nr:hypothetical protein [Thalassovita sp.]